MTDTSPMKWHCHRITHLSIDAAVIESDLVTDLGQTTSGIWEVSLDIYIPDGGTYGGYYNVMQDMELFGAANEWGFQIYFKSDGTGYFYDADFNQTDFTYNVADLESLRSRSRPRPGNGFLLSLMELW